MTRRDINLEHVAVIRAHAGEGINAVMAALGGRITENGVRHAAYRHGIQLREPEGPDARAANVRNVATAVSTVKARTMRARAIAAQRDRSAGHGLHMQGGGTGLARKSLFNPAFGNSPVTTPPLAAGRYAKAFHRDSAKGLVPLTDLPANACKWPFDVRGKTLFCAAPKAPGKRYCASCAEADASRGRAI